MVESEINRESISRRNFLSRYVLGIEGTKGKVSPLKTIRDTGIYLAAVTISAPFLDLALGVPTGNAGFTKEIEEELKANPLQAYKEDAIDAPLQEESIFRIFPNLVIFLTRRNPMSTFWKTGLISSSIFGIAHSWQPEKDNYFNFDFDRVPFYQFTSGLFLWKLMRERGHAHAIFAHAMLNAFGTTLVVTSPEEK